MCFILSCADKINLFFKKTKKTIWFKMKNYILHIFHLKCLQWQTILTGLLNKHLMTDFRIRLIVMFFQNILKHFTWMHLWLCEIFEVAIPVTVPACLPLFSTVTDVQPVTKACLPITGYKISQSYSDPRNDCYRLFLSHHFRLKQSLEIFLNCHKMLTNA